MSTRKSATVVATAVSAWAVAITIAIACTDIHMVFALFVAAASVLTLNLRTGSGAIAGPPGAAAGTVGDKQTKSVVIPIPVEIAHAIGFKQGWQAAELQHPGRLPETSSMIPFERFFRTPPN